jgi:leader peptidase (prepilin peptidase)/N-methyltransferase
VTTELVGSGVPAFFVMFGAFFGAAIGSFLNVCILRWGAEPKESVVRPPSRCPRCGRGLVWYENIPIVSWLVLRGRCRGCGLPISIQYPLVEAATALIWAWFVWRLGLSLEALGAAIFATLLLGIAVTDAREFIIPHEFTYGGMALGLLFSIPQGPAAFVASLQGMIVGAGILYLVGAIGGFFAGREAMGGGDVAMMAMVGAFLGWESVCVTIFIGSCIGVLLHVAGLARSKRAAASAAPVIAGPQEAMPSEIPAAPVETLRDPEFKTKEQLRSEGYLPFGVSLAIAAGLLLVTDARWRIVGWVASYARFLGL